MPKIYLSQAEKDADAKKIKGGKGKSFVVGGKGGKGGKGKSFAVGGKGGKGFKGGRGGAVRQPRGVNAFRSAPYSKVNNNAYNNAQRGVGRGQKTIESMKSTAQAIATSANHPKKREVKELLNCHQKGWVDDQKFKTVLQSLLFK